MAELVNVVSTERIPKGTRFRVTIAQRQRILLNSEFSRLVSTWWSQLASSKTLFPISPNPAIGRGMSVAVIDVQLSRDKELMTEVLRVLDHFAGFHLSIARVEKLTRTKAKQAAGGVGAREREAVKEGREQHEREGGFGGFFGKVGEGIGDAVSLVKWALVAVVVVGVVVLFVYVVPRRAALT